MREPSPHQGIIPFPSIDSWLLRTPSQRLQPPGQIMSMVAHPKRHQNHRTDAPERPPIRVKTSLESAFFEDRQHALPLLNVQAGGRSEEHTSELQSRQYLVCRLLLEKKKKISRTTTA